MTRHRPGPLGSSFGGAVLYLVCSDGLIALDISTDLPAIEDEDIRS